MSRTLLVLAFSMAACGAPDSDECDVGTVTAAVRAADRKLLGGGAVYPADMALRGRDAQLHRSQRARRDIAWNIIAKVLAPVQLAEALPSSPSARVPGWQTWYGSDDVKRVFGRLYDNLGTEGRRARDNFSDDAIDDGFVWNVGAVDELVTWPTDRWQAYLASLDSAAKVAGIGGVSPVLYSPSAARHFLSSYPDIVRCETGGAPDRVVETAGESTQRMLREPVTLSACAQRSFGPFFVAAGETLRAVVAVEQGQAALLDVVKVGSVTGSCKAANDEPCEVAGAGTYHVVVRAAEGAAVGTLTVDYREPRAEWAACLNSAFPVDAVVVKASWRRAEVGLPFPVFDTSDQRLAELLADPNPDWGPGDSTAEPEPDKIYTMQLDNGNVYRLAALHIMTKELDHWTWTTLWWSDTPELDFGADRPANIAALGAPWSSYKMCTVTAFDERDPDPTGGYSDTAPSLARALAASHAGPGGPSWCSNPYLELGPGNAATNCIGCHQHGGTGIRSDAVLGDATGFPAHGRTLVRNNFPADYSYAVDAGDRLGNMFKEFADYYDAFE